VITAVDSNVILDALTADPKFGEISSLALTNARRLGPLIVSEVVFSEVSGQFPDTASAESYLTETGLTLKFSEPPGLHVAGRAWREYTRSRREAIICISCGHRNRPLCDNCKSRLRARQHVVADFLIGAHALTRADRLLTRDRGYYTKYFPRLKILDPGVSSSR